MSTTPCIICNKTFLSSQIADHVNLCLDGLSDAEPMQTDTPKQSDNTKSTSTSTSTSSDNQPKTKEEEDLAKLQEEAWKFWSTKRQQEEEDAKLAQQLFNEKPAEVKPTVVPSKPVVSDADYAKKLYQEEQEKLRKAKELANDKDRRLAEEFWNKEQEELKKKEWDKTLKLMREQAERESQAKIKEAVAEKEDLKRRLKEAREALENAETNVGINLEGTEYPDTWTPSTAAYQLIDVKKHSDEWNKIEQKFQNTMGYGSGSQITRIQRNQNRSLWTFYYLRRDQIALKNRKDPNEQYVYHGSRTGAYDVILKEGFDNRVADMNGSIGAGVYFATHASTSSGYVTSGGWVGDKKMLYCRVALGSVGPGQTGIRRPPEKTPGSPNDLHHSVGQVHGGNGMYAIFDNHQGYPEYVISYK